MIISPLEKTNGSWTLHGDCTIKMITYIDVFGCVKANVNGISQSSRKVHITSYVCDGCLFLRTRKSEIHVWVLT